MDCPNLHCWCLFLSRSWIYVKSYHRLRENMLPAIISLVHLRICRRNWIAFFAPKPYDTHTAKNSVSRISNQSFVPNVALVFCELLSANPETNDGLRLYKIGTLLPITKISPSSNIVFYLFFNIKRIKWTRTAVSRFISYILQIQMSDGNLFLNPITFTRTIFTSSSVTC